MSAPGTATHQAMARQRTGNYVRQIGASIVYKAGAVAASFAMLPLMIGYLGEEQYGVWATLLAVISWSAFFDLGIGSGLRNKVAEALAKNQRDEAALFIASGYTLIAAVAGLLWLLVVTVSFFVPWQSVFNTTAITEKTLRLSVQVTASAILLNFCIGLIGALLGAIQKASLVSAVQLIMNVLILLLVYGAARLYEPSILLLSAIHGFSLVAANLVLTLWFFHRNPDLRPRVHFKKAHVRPILSTGVQFFLMQVSSLLILTTDKLLITQLFGPEHVARYEVVLKLFSIVTFAHALVCGPLWSAYTDAYHRGDVSWIQRMLRKQILLFGALIGASLLLALTTPWLAALWVGTSLQIDISVVWAMCSLTIVCAWNNVFSTALGGIGKVRLSAAYTLTAAAINLPLAYYFSVKLGMGVGGIVAATACSLAVTSFISPLQVWYFFYARTKHLLLDRLLR